MIDHQYSKRIRRRSTQVSRPIPSSKITLTMKEVEWKPIARPIEIKIPHKAIQKISN
jgi:hypothetical protein